MPSERLAWILGAIAVVAFAYVVFSGREGYDDSYEDDGEAPEPTADDSPTDDAPEPADASEETEAPVEDTEAPADETEAPADETEVPADETEAPWEADEIFAGFPMEAPYSVTYVLPQTVTMRPYEPRYEPLYTTPPPSTPQPDTTKPPPAETTETTKPPPVQTTKPPPVQTTRPPPVDPKPVKDPRLEAERARQAKLAEQARQAKLAEQARQAKLAEQARQAKLAEQARRARELERDRLIRQAEARKAEQARLARTQPVRTVAVGKPASAPTQPKRA